MAEMLEITLNEKGDRLILPEGKDLDSPLPIPKGGGPVWERFPTLGFFVGKDEGPTQDISRGMVIRQITIGSVWVTGLRIEVELSYPQDLKTYYDLSQYLSKLPAFIDN